MALRLMVKFPIFAASDLVMENRAEAGGELRKGGARAGQPGKFCFPGLALHEEGI